MHSILRSAIGTCLVVLVLAGSHWRPLWFKRSRALSPASAQEHSPLPPLQGAEAFLALHSGDQTALLPTAKRPRRADSRAGPEAPQVAPQLPCPPSPSSLSVQDTAGDSGVPSLPEEVTEALGGDPSDPALDWGGTSQPGSPGSLVPSSLSVEEIPGDPEVPLLPEEAVAWLYVLNNPPSPPPLPEGVRRGKWKGCKRRQRDWGSCDLVDREWQDERAWPRWGCPQRNADPTLWPPQGGITPQQSRWADAPWRLFGEASSTKTVRVLACLCSHTWAALDLSGRTRRILRVQAAALRRPEAESDSESDTLYVERRLAREEDLWRDQLLGLRDGGPWGWDSD